MEKLSFYDGYIYNRNKKVAVKLYDRTVYMGYFSYITKQNDTFEIWVMNSEKCTVMLNGSTYNIVKGDLLVFSQNDPCDITFIDSTSVFTVLKIHCENFLDTLPKSALFCELMFLNQKNSAFDYHLPLSHPCSNLIKASIDNAKKLFAAKEFGYEFAVLSQITNIFLSLARFSNYSAVAAKQITKKKSPSIDINFKKSLEYIDSHLKEELTLEKISSVAGLTPNYFSNIFRQQTGMKLWDYVSEKRVALAAKLLIENPNDSVITIALKCGYNNCPNFNRSFKKYTGMTPKKYKTSVTRQESFNEKQ